MTGIFFSSESVLHSLSRDQPSLPGIKTSSRINLGLTSRINSMPFSLFVAPISVRFSLDIVLLIRSCMATSSSTRTTRLSSASKLITLLSTSSSLYSGHSRGTDRVKTEPTPSSLVSTTSPPIISANFLDIGKPNPVPP